MIKHRIANLTLRIMGRRNWWRLGRLIYMSARNDVPNDMKTNGETLMLQSLLARHANTGNDLVIFDVGANVGEWTWTALTSARELTPGPAMTIHAFEPVASTFATLKNRLQAVTPDPDVHLVNKALSDREGSAEIHILSESGGTNSLHPDGTIAGSRTTTINLTTLDRYCEERKIKTVHFIKCDTEGHEMNVLKGATGLMGREAVYAIQFEYNHRWVYSRHYLKDVFDIVEGTNYRVGKVVPEGVELYEQWQPELERFFEGNYLIIHNTAMDWFPVREGSFDDANTYSTRVE